MLEFRETADHYSRDVVRISADGKSSDVGSIQWHSGKERRLVVYTDIISQLTLAELKSIVRELEKK